MQLLNGEKQIDIFSKAGIILTNFRLIQSNNSNTGSYLLEVFLEDISSIETKYENDFSLICLAVFFALLQIYLLVNFHKDYYYAGAVIAAICAVLWWRSRKFSIVATAKGGSKLKFAVGRIKDATVYNFIAAIQKAKLERINTLHGLSEK